MRLDERDHRLLVVWAAHARHAAAYAVGAVGRRAGVAGGTVGKHGRQYGRLAEHPGPVAFSGRSG